MLSEISQTEKDKYYVILLRCGIEWTNWTSRANGDRLIDGEQMTAARGRRLGGRGTEQKGKRTHGHGQQCGGRRGIIIRGLKGNVKKIQQRFNKI